jgi:uncharacterized protein YbjT (DUF2867 family)
MNMNSPKDKAASVADATYVILGGSGNTGSIFASSLLTKGQKARVVGRDPGRLQRFVRKGAEAFTADGEMWLELDNGKTLHLHRGDVVVQTVRATHGETMAASPSQCSFS